MRVFVWVFVYISVAMRYPRLKIKFHFWQLLFFISFSLFHSYTLIEIIRMSDLKWSGKFMTEREHQVQAKKLNTIICQFLMNRTKFQANCCEYFAKLTFCVVQRHIVMRCIWYSTAYENSIVTCMCLQNLLWTLFELRIKTFRATF